MWYKNKRNLIIAGIVAVLALSVILWMVLFNKPKPPELVTQPATIGNVERTVLASGTLEPFEQVSVGAQVSGQVTRLAVELGDAVNQGDLIAEIDSQKQKNDLATSAAQLNSQKAQRAAALATLAQAQANFARQATLYEADAGSQAEYEAAQATLRSAQASLDAANAQIDQAEISVQTANVNLGYTRISAPIGGTVIAIVTKQGQTVNANQSAPTIVVLGQLDKMTVKAEISEADVIRIKPGMRVYFTTLGDPDKRYYATLRKVEPAPTNFSGETTTTSTTSSAVYYYGLFDVDNPDGTLRPTMTAQVYIVLEGAQNVLTVPSAALTRSGKGYSVTVVARDKRPAQRAVTVGINDGSNAQILSGLKAGEQVVVAQAKPASGAAASTNSNRAGGGGGPPPGMGGL